MQCLYSTAAMAWESGSPLALMAGGELLSLPRPCCHGIQTLPSPPSMPLALVTPSGTGQCVVGAHSNRPRPLPLQLGRQSTGRYSPPGALSFQSFLIHVSRHITLIFTLYSEGCRSGWRAAPAHQPQWPPKGRV